MTNPRALLDQHGLLPKKSLGQNFLSDPGALEKIVAAADVSPDDTVLEIGPGTGALTAVLARRAKRVIAVEIDRRLEPVLQAYLQPYSNVEVVFQDILETDVAALIGPHDEQPDAPDDFIVVANVPYYITSAIIRHLLEAPRRPRRLVLTVQLEVAERLVARPGNMSLLAVSAQFYGTPRMVGRLKAGAFWPRPDVDSAIVRLDVNPSGPVDVFDDAMFFKVARAGFGQKRKQLKNALAEGLSLTPEVAATILERAGIEPRRRAETLTLAEWAALTRSYAAGG